jgi:signal transduction histidine kinase
VPDAIDRARRRVLERWRFAPRAAMAIAIALLVAGTLISLLNERLYIAQKEHELDVQAHILAASVTAALAFDDQRTAQEYVNAMYANPEIEIASIYDKQGRLIASFDRTMEPSPPLLPDPDQLKPVGDRVVVRAPVVQQTTQLGTVLLHARGDSWPRRIARHLGTALLIGMAALVLAVLGAAQGALTRVNRDLDERARELAAANNELKIQMKERERAEERLRESQKMEALGRLTGGVAHDFNNLLMVASGGLEMLDRHTDPPRQQRIKDGIRQAIDRGTKLTRQLLAFSRRQALQPETIELAAKVESMRILLERSLREDIRLDLRVMPDLWPVTADPGEFELALLNLTVNARDAMPNGGVVTIAAEPLPDLREGDLSGDYVRVILSDTGTGMSPEVQRRVFEPFFTTKEVGKGTGLGLSQVYGFARASGGDVRIESQPGRGTTVSILLPRAAADAPNAPTPLPEAQTVPPPISAGVIRGAILLVEDDDAVAEFVGDMLRELGFVVTRAENAIVGLARIETDAEFDLVFSDTVMPGGMDGIDLAREIRRRWPALPVLLTTGYSEAAQAATNEGLRLLLKPYRMDMLAAAIDAALRRT